LFVFRDFVFQLHASRLFASSSPTFMKLISDLVQAINPVNFLEVRAFIQRGEFLPVARYIQDDSDYKNDIDEDGNDLLMKAVMSQHMHIVRYLFDHGFSLSRFNKDGKSVLILAAEGGNLDILKCLLSKATQADLQAFQKKEITLLSTALTVNNTEIRRCVINALIEKSEGSEFFHLIDNGLVLEVNDYLESKSKTIFSVEDERKSRSLVSSAHRQSVLSSIRAGERLPYINKRGSHGESALHRLVALNFQRIMRRQFPRHLPAQHSRFFVNIGVSSLVLYDQMMSVFIAHGINLHALDNQGNTALMVSAKTPMYFITKDLITRKINVNVQNKHGETALMIAARAGHVETVRELINGGADIHLQNNEGKTAFDLAKHGAVLELLQSTDPKTYHERDPGGTSAPKRMKR
jgi:ankyrin repeat protein